jgi:hypothetical protein
MGHHVTTLKEHQLGIGKRSAVSGNEYKEE